MQAAYLLLWTVYERLTALRYGPSRDVMARLQDLERDKAFREAFHDCGARTGEVVCDSRDLATVRIGADGSKALDYWYQVRSNLSHRGKSAYRDSKIVYEAFEQAYLVLDRLISKLVHQRAPDERPATAVSFEDFFRSDRPVSTVSFPSPDKFLSRLFGLFSEDVVRHWCRCPEARYGDLGRPYLRFPTERYGHTLDFTLRDRQTGETFVAELKCELEYDNYRYLRLTDALR